LKFIDDKKSEKKRRSIVLSIRGLLPSSSPVIMLIIFVVVTIVFSSTWVFLLPFSYAQQQQQQKNTATNSAACISYDSTDNIITITCSSASLTDINNQLNDNTILDRQQQQISDNGVWLLNAGIMIAEDAALYINSTDTKWLKIVSDGNTPNRIAVYGSLKIDSVKITSWNPEINDYAITDVQGKIPRPFIIVEDEATGTTDITNSEIAYLGYAAQLKEDNYARRSGLVYNGGDGSIIRGNHIHHNMFGFYSKGVGDIILEDNLLHDNSVYGFDPHTGTHDMIIRNNTVHTEGHIGIICSLDCYNITVEGNKVYNNTDVGIMFSRNMSDSVARNNYLHDETQCIFVSQSHNNEVYNNTVSDCENGIYLRDESSNNKIYDNTIINSKSNGILINTGAHDNTFSSNTIINATEFGINADQDSGSVNNNKNNNNRFENNKLINSKVAGQQE
jgi:poly(beta-D-mannuronate) C5 epimerase